MGEVSNAIVYLMVTCIVFFGLICIVLLCILLSNVCRLRRMLERNDFAQASKAPPAAQAAMKTKPPVAATPAADASTRPKSVVSKRGEIIAAVSAAIAEETGADISGIRILSFRRIKN